MHVIQAIGYVRRLRGGSQSHVLECDDGRKYVTKLLGNPQADRVLANEFLCTHIARSIGLSVPDSAIVDVDEGFICRTPELRFSFGSGESAPRAGHQFGSRLVEDDYVYDYVPPDTQFRNIREFAGALAFDKWTCQADGRQALFTRRARQRTYNITLIDFGYAFNVEWSWPDSPMRGVAARVDIYSGITGWKDFEPWLSRIENFQREDLAAIASGLPVEWHEDPDGLERLLDGLILRRSKVRELITTFRESSRNPFPNWKQPSSNLTPSLELVYA